MRTDANIEHLLRHFPSLPPRERRECLGSAGGFSGARFWRIVTPAGRFCLRRWPAGHPSPERLRFIHAALLRAQAAGLDFVPAPLSTDQGHTFVRRDGALWELTAWLPGEADYVQRPGGARLAAAMKALARFHLAVADAAGADRVGPSRGIAERLERLRWFRGEAAARIRRELDRTAAGSVLGETLREHGPTIVERFVSRADEIERELVDMVELIFPQQPSIRDVWHAHVLYTGDRVTGLVDYGAMRIESVAGDVARLLGSMTTESNNWTIGMDAYESVRPLSHIEHSATGVFDRSGKAMAGMNWLTWLLLEGRTFEDERAVAKRIGEIVQSPKTGE